MNPWEIMAICGILALLISVCILRPVEKTEKEANEPPDFGSIIRNYYDQIRKDETARLEKIYGKWQEKAENPDRYYTVKQINIKTGRIECHISYPTLKEAQDKGAEWLKPYPGIPQDHYVAIFSDDRIHQAAGNKLIPLEDFGAETMKAIRENNV